MTTIASRGIFLFSPIRKIRIFRQLFKQLIKIKDGAGGGDELTRHRNRRSFKRYRNKKEIAGEEVLIGARVAKSFVPACRDR